LFWELGVGWLGVDVIDSHCHLAGPEFADDLDAVIDRARAAGLRRALVILAADDEPELRQGGEVAGRWNEVRFSIGIHPHAAGKFSDDPAGAAAAVSAAMDAQPLTRGLGEIGLDYHYDYAPREVQQAVFREQIGLARARRLPIVIHTREAEDDTFRILTEESAGEIGGVFHCFTGGREMARRALDAGFHLSLAGIVTFPRAVELHEVARDVPLDRLLVETDSPFLAPVPYRGKRNEPAHVVKVAEAIAALRGITAEAVGRAAADNFDRLFNP
jgi:TatD DNase family protein